jgi:ATP-binding cassette, subfamily G (WHITE), member 2, SNQ2
MSHLHSGLDSEYALATMKLLKKVCVRHGVSAVVIIHQPSGYVFDTFDRLVLLSNGHCIYSDSVDHLPDWYRRAWNEEIPLSKHEIPLDLMQKLKDPPKTVYDLYTSMSKEMAPSIKLSNQWHRISINSRTSHCSHWKKFQIVFHRNLVNNYVRDYTNLAARMVSYAMVALLNAALFWQTGSQESSMEFVIGASTFIIMALYLLPFAVIPVHVYDKKFFLAERNLGLYSPWIYALSQLLLEIWVLVLLATETAAIVIPAVGFWNPSQPHWATFFSILACIIASGLVGSAMVQFFAIVAPSQDLAYIVGSGVSTLALGLSGGFVPFPFMRGFIRWAQWLSPCKYSLQALLLSYGMDTERESRLDYLGFDSPGTSMDNVAILFAIFAFLVTCSTIALARQRVS